MDFDFGGGSIFKDFEDLIGDFLGTGRSPKPPKHLPLRILGLSGDPWPDEIRSAYRAKLLATHPDLKPAFENPDFQEMAQKSRGKLPDIQELVWARDCALAQAPKPKPVTDDKPGIMGTPSGVTELLHRPRPPAPERFNAEVGKPRVCWMCGKQIEPMRLEQKYGDQRVICDACGEAEQKNRDDWGWNYYHRRCAACGVWTEAGWQTSKYCSYECSRVAESKRRRERRKRQRADRVCPVCRKQFTPKRSDGKYCSAVCRQRAFRVTTKRVHTR